MSPSSVKPAVSRLAVLFALAASAPARGDEVCDEFPEVHASWAFRLPKCGGSYSLDEREGYLRLRIPDGTVAGDYDAWSGADRAPSLERSDMGSGDWKITTRLEFETFPFGTNYHAGLVFGFGPASRTDWVFWGQYTADGTFAVERSGRNLRPTYTGGTGPVSLQVEKAGDTYYFRHRNDDATDWIDDRVETTEMASAFPVTKVGLLVKTWGGGGAPEVVADFDYFCLEVPGTVLPPDPVADPIPVLTPITSLACEKKADGSVALGWTTCDGSTTPAEVTVNGVVVATVPPAETSALLAPPLPGGSIINVEVDNGFERPAACTLANTLADICDEFDEDPLISGDWQFRTPRLVDAGPTIDADQNPGFLRFFVPSGAAAGGHFDNWTGADFAPTLERYDMGTRDWVISTRLGFPEEIGSPAANHHVGLMVAYGLGAPSDGYNDVTYWGQYGNPGSIRIERTGSALTAVLPYPGAPVSLQVQKVGSTLIFSHRQDDADPWTSDASIVPQLPFGPNAGASPPAGTPVSRVGLIIKTWGGGGSPEVTADFDYFCLRVADSPPEAAIEASPLEGTVPLEVSFSGAGSVDPSGGTLTHAWDFGDGAGGTGAQVKHTYTKAGLTTATLTVTDDEKNAGKASVELFLSEDAAPFELLRLGDQGRAGLVTVDRTGAAPLHCLTAGGRELGVATDHGHLLARKLAGDFKVQARIASGDFSSQGTRAGLMARLAPDARSPNVLMSIDGLNDGYQFQYRRTAGGTTNRANVTITPPRGPLAAWVQLERQGTMFIGSYSTDGATYTEYARQDIPGLGVAELLVGLAATSGAVGSSATFCAELSGFPGGPARPARPVGLTAAPGDRQVTLAWIANAEPDLLGYNVYRSIAGEAYARINAAPVALNAHIDVGLTPSIDHCYRVRAVNAAGESPDSDFACATPFHRDSPAFRRGDVNADGKIDVTDPVKLLGFLFLGQAKPECLDAGDTDDSGLADISDAVSNLGFQFLGGPAPVAPGPQTCGPDQNPEEPELGCDAPCV